MSAPASRKRSGSTGSSLTPHFVMQVRTRGAAGRTDPAEHRAGLDFLAFGHQHLGHMAVAGRKAIAVIDLDHIAVAAERAGVDDAPGGGGVDISAPKACTRSTPGCRAGRPRKGSGR